MEYECSQNDYYLIYSFLQVLRKEVKNLRSQVSSLAIVTCRDMFAAYKKPLEPVGLHINSSNIYLNINNI